MEMLKNGILIIKLIGQTDVNQWQRCYLRKTKNCKRFEMYMVYTILRCMRRFNVILQQRISNKVYVCNNAVEIKRGCVVK